MLRTLVPIALLLAVMALEAAAQSPGAPSSALPAVEIRTAGTSDNPRTDVRTVCPKIQEELAEGLATAWQRVGKPGIVTVQLSLQGRKLDEIRPLSGDRRYHHYVRSAVADLGCSGDRPAEQWFVFNIRFVDIYAEPGHRLANLQID